MAKPKTTTPVEQAAEEVTETETTQQEETPVEQAAEEVKAPPADGMIRVRVVKQVEGKQIGDEFETTPHAVRLQIKHKSIEII